MEDKKICYVGITWLVEPQSKVKTHTTITTDHDNFVDYLR